MSGYKETTKLEQIADEIRRTPPPKFRKEDETERLESENKYLRQIMTECRDAIATMPLIRSSKFVYDKLQGVLEGAE